MGLTSSDAQSIMEKLQAPFPPEEIEWRVGSTNTDKTKGLALGYVTNRAIQDRLDEVFGVFGWRNEFLLWRDNAQLCGISVLVDGQWITKWDGADNSNMEAVKGGLSDSMKRAAYQWGIGRYLYKLPDQWCKLKNGKYLDETPKLPDWALPEEYRGKQRQQVSPRVIETKNESTNNTAGTVQKLNENAPQKTIESKWNPILTSETKGLWTKLGVSSEEMKKAYYAKFGSDLTPENHKDFNEFLKKELEQKGK